jgi:cytochrome c-type biogenesis protein CcmF
MKSKTKIIFESIEQKEEKNFKSIIGNFNIENSMDNRKFIT